MRIVLTGGHLTPALAVISWIKTEHPECELHFIGREYSSEKYQQKAAERSEVEALGIPFHPFQAPRMRSWRSFLQVPAFLMSLSRARSLLTSIRPDVVLSFGGYLSLPVVLAAAEQKIQTILHEQTHSLGLSNRFAARRADILALSFADTQKIPRSCKTAVVGPLIRPSLFEKSVPPTWAPKGKKPLLLVSGGNQGAEALNRLVAAQLAAFCSEYRVVHSTGLPKRGVDDLQALEAARKSLSPAARDRYAARPWLSVQEYAWALQEARVVLARAGANTVAELRAFDIPSVLIPLPQARDQEQLHNARWLAERQATVIFSQDQPQAERVFRELKKLSTQEQAETTVKRISQARTENEGSLTQLYQLMEKGMKPSSKKADEK